MKGLAFLGVLMFVVVISLEADWVAVGASVVEVFAVIVAAFV